MATDKETGIIEKTYEGAHIEWRIPDFSTIAEIKDSGYTICYNSPTFFINGVRCYLELFPVSGLDPKFMRLYLTTNGQREYSLEYNFSLKKSDGSAKELVCGILKGNNTRHDVGNLIKKAEIMQRKSDLAHENAFTILCKFKRIISCSTQPTEETAPLKLIKLDKLSENFKDLFGDQETCDTTLKVKDKEYKAHKSVLIARSSVFAATFKHDTLERQTGIVTITDCDPDSFAIFLEYVYSGKLEGISACSAFNLYYTSDKYDVQELKTFCIEYLMQQLTVENVCEVAVFADKYEETALFSSVQDFFNENASKIFGTSEWQCFMIKENRLASKLLLEMSKVKLKD